jgi:hypothetical protein
VKAQPPLITLYDVYEAFEIDCCPEQRLYSNLCWVTTDGAIHLFFTMK